MHILILNSEYPPIGGGAGNASAHIAHELARLDQQVTVLTSTFKNQPREETRGGVRVLRLPALRAQADRSTTVEQVSFMLSSTIRGFGLVRRLKPDVVLAFFGAPSGVAAWIWSFFFKLPYIVSLRGGDVPGFRPYDFRRQHRLLAPWLRQVWRRAAAVVANSEGLRQLGCAFEDRVEIKVIPNGVDLDKFPVPQRPWAPLRMLFVGRIVYQKGLDLLLQALSQLGRQDWELDLVGDGPGLNKLKQQSQRLNIADRVHFAGWLSREQLPAALAAANLFVYPSRHEGMPNAVLEAMASGLPVLATRIAGNEELVTQETGVLVPSDDPDALRSALETLLPDAAGRERMGAAARKRTTAEYSWRRIAQAYLDLMRGITGKQ